MNPVSTHLWLMLSLVGEYLEEACFLLGFTDSLWRAAVLSRRSPEMLSKAESVLAFLKTKHILLP